MTHRSHPTLSFAALIPFWLALAAVACFTRMRAAAADPREGNVDPLQVLRVRVRRLEAEVLRLEGQRDEALGRATTEYGRGYDVGLFDGFAAAPREGEYA